MSPCGRIRRRRGGDTREALFEVPDQIVNSLDADGQSNGPGPDAGGVPVIMDRCIKVEHARYFGRMHWLGFNTQRITSVRGGLQ